MLHKNILIKACVRELKEQLVEVTKRKGRKRKRIQHGWTLEYGVAALTVAESASSGRTIAKRARGSGSQEPA